MCDNIPDLDDDDWCEDDWEDEDWDDGDWEDIDEDWENQSMSNIDTGNPLLTFSNRTGPMDPHHDISTAGPTVTVVVEGGVVQHVAVPLGVRAVVRDYDVDTDDSDLSQDENGDHYIEGIWE